MNIYLVGRSPQEDFCRVNKVNEDMNLYLAGELPWREEGIYQPTIKENKGVLLLQSFFYANEWVEQTLPLLGGFMLDSGAFTFLTQGKKANWGEYLERYANFINKNNVELFFELDIDALIGYDKVLALRRDLEKLTGKQPIPVWHRSRGKQEFFRMCDEYPYVAIGDIVSKEIKRKEFDIFPWFIKEAHKRGAKIHGLGFANLQGLKKYHFDSVDSSAWLCGNRFGHVYEFNGSTIIYHKKPPNHRLKNPQDVAIHNFKEWVKFQQYAKTHL